jgi:predicted permease
MTPPRLAGWLLSVRLPASDRDEVVGDLNEEFAEVSAERGGLRARIWYWRHALRLARTLGGRPPAGESLGVSRSSRMSFDDLRYAMRRLKKQPAATLASIATLACAIGVAVAAWSLLSAALLRPLPLVKTDGLVTIGQQSAEATTKTPTEYRHTYQTYRAVKESGAFEHVSAFGLWGTILTLDGVTTHPQLAFVADDYFETLGVQLRVGREFLPEDDRPGAKPVAVLSDRFWRSAMKADPAVLGRDLTLRGRLVSIIGIAPAGFDGLSLGHGPDFYVPIHTVAALSGNDSNWLSAPSRRTPIAWLQLVARLRPGTDAAQAAARVAGLALVTDGKKALYVATDLATAALPESARPAMGQFARLLAITVGLLLLIGCMTVGMLVLLRTEARRDEFALCLALGATRTRLAGGVLLEAALLSIAGAALAVPMSEWFKAGIRAFVLPGRVSIELLDLPLDWRTMVAAMGAAAAATLVIALIAGIFGVSANVADALRARAGVTRRIGRQRTRAALVIAQIAVALVLLAGAGLFARSLSAALSLNPNHDTGQVAQGVLWLGDVHYTEDRGRTFFADLRERLAHDPAIRSVSFKNRDPRIFDAVIDGEYRTLPSFADGWAVDDRYFMTFGTPVLKGRDFTADDRATSQPVVIVSASLGRFIARGGDPLGHHIQGPSPGPGQPAVQYEIVGVVPDVIASVQSLEPLVMYRPIAQAPTSLAPTMALSAAGDPALAVHDATAVIHAMEPSIAIPQLMTINAYLNEEMGPQRFGATLLGGLGAIAALLTLFGMYVLAESMAAVRRREMGVRAALGASRSQLSARVLSQTTRLVGMGIGVGLLLTWLGAGLIRAFLFRIEAFDLPTIATVIVVMFGLTMAVTLRPALRAASVDLARLLREE